jgi:nucleoside-diphosphate kinase
MTVTTAPHRHTPIFFMIKPDGIPHETVIMHMIEPLASVLARRPFDPVDMRRVERLYAVHKDKPFYPRLMDYFREMPIVAYLLSERPDMVYQNGFYASFIDLVGDTDPARALPGTIRSLSRDALQKSLAEKRAVRNLVHRSTTVEETFAEAPLFFWDHVHDNSKVRGAPGVLGRFLARAGEGIFFDERVESALKRHNLLSADEELVYYQDYRGREGDALEQGRALVETRVQGTRVIKNLTPPSSSSSTKASERT